MGPIHGTYTDASSDEPSDASEEDFQLWFSDNSDTSWRRSARIKKTIRDSAE